MKVRCCEEAEDDEGFVWVTVVFVLLEVEEFDEAGETCIVTVLDSPIGLSLDCWSVEPVFGGGLASVRRPGGFFEELGMLCERVWRGATLMLSRRCGDREWADGLAANLI